MQPKNQSFQAATTTQGSRNARFVVPTYFAFTTGLYSVAHCAKEVVFVFMAWSNTSVKNALALAKHLMHSMLVGKHKKPNKDVSTA